MKSDDLDAKHYRDHSSTQYGLAHELLEQIVFQGNETILDIGCGDGRITSELAKSLPKGILIGVDSSFSMIDLAMRSFPKNQYPNLEFKQISAEALSLNSFADMILVINALHWMQDPNKALYNMMTALKPEGRLFILTYPKESPYWLFLEETLKAPEWKRYQSYSTYGTMLNTQEYVSLLTNLGMKIDDVSTEERIAIYQTKEDLRDYIKGWRGITESCV